MKEQELSSQPGAATAPVKNAYWLDAGWVNVYGERQIYDGPGYAACGVFVAETPSQAKYDALREFNNDVEWNEFRVRLLTKDLDLPRGHFDDTWPEGPWYEDDSIPPPEPYRSIAEGIARVHLGPEAAASGEKR